MHTARQDLERQARYLFADTSSSMQNSILIGCSGRLRVAERKGFQAQKDFRGEDVEDDEDENEPSDLETQTTKGKTKSMFEKRSGRRNHDGSDDLVIIIRPALDTSDIRAYQALLYDDAEKAWAAGEWSLFLRLGTKESNQRFYLIHKHLSNVTKSSIVVDG